MKPAGFVHLLNFNTAVNDAQTLRKMIPVRDIVPDEIKLFGVAYQIRVLQVDIPNLTPWMGITYSKQQNDSIFWNSAQDLVIPGVFHSDSYEKLPSKDEFKFPGDGLDLSFSDTIHLTLTVENLDPINVFNKTLRVHTIFYYELISVLERKEIDKWQKTFTNVR